MVTLLVAMMMIESNGDVSAWNASEGAFGPYQIRHYGTSYEIGDFRSVALSRWAVVHYGRMYGATTPEAIARVWNGGPKGASRRATLGYWKRVKGAM